MRFLLGCVLFLAMIGLMASWGLGSLLTRPTPATIADAEAPAHDLAIMAKDGVRLTGTYWPGARAGAPAVLLLHGAGASRRMMAANAAWLASRGYAVLTIDFRGHGGSTPVGASFGLFESRDAEAALEWLRKRQGGARIAVVGVSLGGAAALLGEKGPLEADALVLQAVYPDIRHAIRNRIASAASPILSVLLEPLLSYQSLIRYGVAPGRLSPLNAIRNYKGPVLVIGGGADRFTPPSETRRIFDAAPGPKQLWIVDGADHRQVSGLTTDNYRQRLYGFLARTMPIG
jgi:pimeloyl-ACP methyl ester carboxylesterase